MATYVRNSQEPGPRLVVSDRRQLMRAAEARLSGAASEHRGGNPVDMAVAPFSRVTQFEIHEAPLTRVRAVPAPVDDSDW